MPHCTTNFAWYLGKFIVGFAGMLFFYVGFLKEKEYSCLCKPRMREFNRQKSEKGEKRSDRCQCIEGQQKKEYSCGCKKQIQLNRFSISGCRTTTESQASKQDAPSSTVVAVPGGDHSKNDNAVSAYVNAESVDCKGGPGIGENSKLTNSSTSPQKKQFQSQYHRCCCERDRSSTSKRRRRQGNVQKPSIDRRASEIDAASYGTEASEGYTQKNITDNSALSAPNAEYVRKRDTPTSPKTIETGSQMSRTALEEEGRVKNRWRETMNSKQFVNRTVSSIMKDKTPSTAYFDAMNSFTHDNRKRVGSDSHIILGRRERTRLRSAPTTNLCTGCRAKKNVSALHPRTKSSDQRLDRERNIRPEADILYANATCIRMKNKDVIKSESKRSFDFIEDRSDRRYDSIANDRLNDETDCCSCCCKRSRYASGLFRGKQNLRTGSRPFKSSSQSDVDSVALRNEEFQNFPDGRRSAWTSDRYATTNTTAGASFDDRNFGAVFSDAPSNFMSKSRKHARVSRLATPLPSYESTRNYSTDDLRQGKRSLEKISFLRAQPMGYNKPKTSNRESTQKALSMTPHVPRTIERKCICGRNRSLQNEPDRDTTSGSSIEIRNMSEATLKHLLRMRRRAATPRKLAFKSKSFENETTDTINSQANSVCSCSSSFIADPTEYSSQLSRAGRGCFRCKQARKRNSCANPRKTYKTTSSSTSSLSPCLRCRSIPASPYNTKRADRTSNFETSCTSTCSENVMETSKLETLRELSRTSSSSSSASARNARKSSSNDSFLSAVRKRIHKRDSSFEMRIRTARKWNGGRRRLRRKRRKAGIIFEGRDEYDSHENMPCCIEYYEEVQNLMLVTDCNHRRLPVLEESDRAIDDEEEEEEDENVEENSAAGMNALAEDSWRRVRFMNDEMLRECEVIEEDDSGEFDSERWRRRSVSNRRAIVTIS